MSDTKEDSGAVQKDRMLVDTLGEDIAITPSDIYNQDFKRAMLGGYDARAVDAFLERVADMVERLLSQIRHLKEKVDEQRASIDEYREIEKTLRSALVSSQKFSEDILASAKREAESLIEEARLQKAQAQLAAAKLPRKLVRDIHVLEQQRSRMRREMMAILETHKSLLDSLIPEDVGVPTSFFDAGVGSDTDLEDEDKDLPVVNIAEDDNDAERGMDGFASFSPGESADDSPGPAMELGTSAADSQRSSQELKTPAPEEDAAP